MMTLGLDPRGRALRVLCLGAHSDDLEIGCGGTILTLVRSCAKAEIDWVVWSAAGKRKTEAEAGAAGFLRGAAVRRVHIKDFRDGYFPYAGAAIKDAFEELKRTVRPDVIFTHARHDRHQDHRLIAELTWQTFRDHLILEYEIAKYDGDLRPPNVFVPLEKAVCARKIGLVLKTFRTQARNAWFSEDAFRALLRLRGIESNARSGYAEGFTNRKLILA